MKTLTRIQSNNKVIKWGGCGLFNKDIYAVRVLRLPTSLSALSETNNLS